MITTVEESFAQGARCGHIDGQNRVGLYRIGEEVFLSQESIYSALPDADALDEQIRLAWLGGYQLGYRIAAEGELLPVEYQYPVECKPKSWA